MANLFLVRHGLSEWNKLGLWTGLTDVSLAEEGKEEAKRAGKILQNYQIDIVYASPLKRVRETLEGIKKSVSIKEEIIDKALNERDYGDYTGKNKWQIKEEVGEKKFQEIRRRFDSPIPNGEALKDVFDRVSLFYREYILASMKKGKNVLVVASGNSLRALVKYLENISDKDIENVEIGTGEVLFYEIDKNGHILSKKLLAENDRKLKI